MHKMSLPLQGKQIDSIIVNDQIWVFKKKIRTFGNFHSPLWSRKSIIYIDLSDEVTGDINNCYILLLLNDVLTFGRSV